MNNFIKPFQLLVFAFIVICETLFNPTKGVFKHSDEKCNQSVDTVITPVCNEDSILFSTFEN